jgi:hypothetical protein
MRSVRLIPALAFSALLVACESDTVTPTVSSDPVPEAQLRFLRPATSVTLSRDSASFWAVKGQDREIAMYYRPNAGRSDSVRFLRFRVRKEALLARPGGALIANGDSIRITIRILDFTRLITEFVPSGLTFAAEKPAELRLDFRNANQDFNRDGAVNQTDANLIASFAIWKQEAVGQPWFKLTSAVEVDADFSEVKADIVSFTSYAIAY